MDRRAGGDGSASSKRKKEGDEEAQGGTVGWADSVDRLLDASPRFVTALRAAFIRFQDPKTATIPATSLLPALQLLLQFARVFLHAGPWHAVFIFSYLSLTVQVCNVGVGLGTVGFHYFFITYKARETVFESNRGAGSESRQTVFQVSYERGSGYTGTTGSWS